MSTILILFTLACSGRDKEQDTGESTALGWQPSFHCPGSDLCPTADGTLVAGAGKRSIVPECFESWRDCGEDGLCEGDDGYIEADSGENDGEYDCIVSGGGGKDSMSVSHMLKYKYGMHPLTITYSPLLYTDVGWRNMQNWINKGGFDNYLFTPNGKVASILAREALENFDGCKVVDERVDGGYSTPIEAEGKNETFISRIREDKTIENGLNLWIVSDNLLRGAALNSVEIAETLIKNNFYGK